MNYCGMTDNLDTKKTHSHPWQTQKLKYTLTNFCESFGKEKTQDQIDAAFETWQSVRGLKSKRVEPDEELEVKITFLNIHDEMHGLNCPYKLSGQKGGTLAHAFYPGKSAISGYIHFDSENWTDQKTVAGDGKHNLFSVAVHELGHALGLYHNTEDKDSILQPIYKSGFSNKILSESDIKTIQEMYGAARNVIVTAILASKSYDQKNTTKQKL